MFEKWMKRSSPLSSLAKPKPFASLKKLTTASRPRPRERSVRGASCPSASRSSVAAPARRSSSARTASASGRSVSRGACSTLDARDRTFARLVVRWCRSRETSTARDGTLVESLGGHGVVDGAETDRLARPRDARSTVRCRGPAGGASPVTDDVLADERDDRARGAGAAGAPGAVQVVGRLAPAGRSGRRRAGARCGCLARRRRWRRAPGSDRSSRCAARARAGPGCGHRVGARPRCRARRVGEPGGRRRAWCG